MKKTDEECPVATVIGHHPAYQMGACYGGPFEISEYEIIGGYLQEPLRLTPSETWGERLLVPADAEIVIEGALLPGKRMVEGPFGEVNGYLGVQGFQQSAHYEVRAITRRRGAMHTSILTPEGDKPWMDLAREGAYLRRCREAVPSVQAVCASGRHALLNVFISMKKMSEGDPGRAAAAALTWDWAKNVFVFDEDIDVYNPTEILWALATRVQPHRQISIIPEIMRGSLIDPSMTDAAQDFRDDRRRHQTAGSAVLAGIQMSRRGARRGSSWKNLCQEKSCSTSRSIERLIGRDRRRANEIFAMLLISLFVCRLCVSTSRRGRFLA